MTNLKSRGEHDCLGVFLGKWHAEGESYATGQSSSS